MPIPSRFRLKTPSDDLVREMCSLCSAIERAIERGDDAEELLAKWHQHATRRYDPSEFSSYWKAIDQDDFVREAVNPRPTFIKDLLYPEAAAVLDCVSNAELPEHELSFFLEWLEVQFPNSNMSALVYWPDEWFGDASIFRDRNGAFKPEAELSIDQVLAYAMAKSSRKLADAPPNVLLPFPVPPK